MLYLVTLDYCNLYSEEKPLQLSSASCPFVVTTVIRKQSLWAVSLREVSPLKSIYISRTVSTFLLVVKQMISIGLTGIRIVILRACLPYPICMSDANLLYP